MIMNNILILLAAKIDPQLGAAIYPLIAMGVSLGARAVKKKIPIKHRPWALQLLHYGGTISITLIAQKVGLPGNELGLLWAAGIGAGNSLGAQIVYDKARGALQDYRERRHGNNT